MSRTLLFKAAVTFALAMLLMVPLGAIRGLVLERQARRDSVVADIQRSSVTAQKLVGPLLVVPFRRTVIETVTDALGRKADTPRVYQEQIAFVPEELDVTATATTEHRQRGIYSALLYTTTSTITGSFSPPADFGVTSNDPSTVSYAWDAAYVVLGITDTRGIKGRLVLDWDDGGEKKAYEFRGGIERAPPIGNGVHAPVGVLIRAPRVYRFTIRLQLQGAQSLELVAAGKSTSIAMTSPWPHPSFIGQFLPETRTIGTDGFQARWRTSRLASNIEAALQSCGSNCNELLARSLGVAFVQPVDLYLQTERSAKYGFLFILFTFVLFGLFELLERLAIHPVQYALVGVALAMFFLLLIALSEHLPFFAAYLIASSSCVLLLAFYVSHVLGKIRRGAGFAGLLALLYAALYVLLQSEDMALVLGAVLLFAILAGIMTVTRRVDWYRIAARDAAL